MLWFAYRRNIWLGRHHKTMANFLCVAYVHKWCWHKHNNPILFIQLYFCTGLFCNCCRFLSKSLQLLIFLVAKSVWFLTMHLNLIIMSCFSAISCAAITLYFWFIFISVSWHNNYVKSKTTQSRFVLTRKIIHKKALVNKLIHIVLWRKMQVFMR